MCRQFCHWSCSLGTTYFYTKWILMLKGKRCVRNLFSFITKFTIPSPAQFLELTQTTDNHFHSSQQYRTVAHLFRQTIIGIFQNKNKSIWCYQISSSTTEVSQPQTKYSVLHSILCNKWEVLHTCSKSYLRVFISRVQLIPLLHLWITAKLSYQ